MNKISLAECVGGIFRLRPNPIVTKTKKPIKESVNSWTFEAFPERKILVLQHNHSDYKIEIPAVNVRGHEPPDMLSICGKVFLEDDLKFSFEPFTEGMSAADPAELVEDPTNRESKQLYSTLKPHEGKVVSVRFPKGEDGTIYGPCEAILLDVTPHFVKLHQQALTINFFDNIPNFPPLTRIPEYKTSIALRYIELEEDDEHGCRPRLVMDYSHWKPEL